MTRRRSLTAACAAATCCVLTAPATVLAAADPKDPYGEKTPLSLPTDTATHAQVSSGGGGALVRTFVGLAVVVAVIYGLTWVLRQMKAAREDRAVGYGLATEASVPLGPGRSVHLIRAGRELVLVGSAEQGVVPIRTYTEEEARRLGLLAPEQLESGDGPSSSGGGAPRAAGAVQDLIAKLRERTVR